MGMLSTLRQILRNLWSSRGFSAAFLITLGLGIGANSAIFSIVNGVLLRPLPYPEADRIVYLEQPARLAGHENRRFSFVEVADYRAQSRTMDQFVEFGDWTFNVLGRGDPHRATGGLVTANFFEVLGLRPLHGRTLLPEDEGRAAAPVVVLTYEYWLRVFGGDPGAVGQTLDLTAKKATIVGVLEPGSHYASERKQDFYTNYASNDHYLSAAMQDERSHRMTEVFARLAPGASLQGASQELQAIKDRLHQQYPENYPASQGFDLELTPWLEELTQRARPTLLILLAVAGFVLVLACANVGNLTLTRLIQRERELAIRAALGATPARLRRLLLAENLVLACGGAVLGLALAAGGLDLLVRYASRFTNRTGEIALDGWVLGFTLLIAVVAALLFAWLPGLPFSQDLGNSLAAASGGRATGSWTRRRMQRLLVVGQLAISVVLLFGAGLFLRSLLELYAVDPGFDLENVLSLEAPDYSGSDQAQRRAFTDSLLTDLGAHPEVRRAAVASGAPLTRSFPTRREFEVDGRAVESAEIPVSVFRVVSGAYFETVGTPLVAGRTFDTRDHAEAPNVAVLSRSMADHYFRGLDPLGRSLRWKQGNDQWSDPVTVVGVAADSKAEGLEQGPVHTVYLPDSQRFPPSTVLVRARDEAGRLAPQVVEKIRSLDPNRPVDHILTLEELRAEHLAPQRLNALLFSLFALLALLVAAVGVFGVLGFSVTQRTHEIGIRLAVGAEPRGVLGMVLREGVVLTLLGLLAGGAAALLLSRFLESFLFEVEPADPLTFLMVGAILLAIAVLAALGPARRATSVDPMRTLRSE